MIGVSFTVAELNALSGGTDITDQLDDADCRIRLNEEGIGGVTVPFGETITPSPIGKAIVVRLDGTPAFTFLPNQQRDVEVDPAEEYGMVTEYSGPGLAGLLNRYRCAPTLGPERSPWALTRTFSAFSPEYDPTAWGTATTYGDLLTPTDFWDGLPAGFPAFDVQRIGPSSGDDASAPQGYWWTQKDFTLAAATLVRFFVAADNAADVYIDGFQLGRIDSGGDTTAGFRTAKQFTVYLDAGTHRVGAKVVNTTPDGADPGYGEGTEVGGNPTFFMLVGYEAGGDGRLGDRVVETDATWKLLAYPTTPPGLTDAEVVEILLDESVAAGVDPAFTVTVHGTHTPRETITLDVGQSLLAHLKDRADGSFLDWAVPPTALELHVYLPEGRGSASGVTFSTAGENLLRLQATQLDVDITGLWVTYIGGHTFVGTGDKPSSLRTRAATIGEAKALAQAILDRDPQPEQVTVDIAPLAGQVPGVDVLDGDTVTAGTFLERVIGWSMTWSDANSGEPEFDLDLKNRIRGDEERLALMVQRAAPGQLGGSAPASPAADPPSFDTRVNSSEVTFQALKDGDGDYVVAVSDAKRTSNSGNLYAVQITATTAGSTSTTVHFLVDGTDVLAGAGVLPSTETFVVIPVDPPFWVTAWVNDLQASLVTIGTGLDGLLVEPLFV